MPEVQLTQGTIRYRDTGGSGEPIVFVHGFLVDGALWRGVADRLSDDFRCVMPDLPLGSHRTPMRPDADLTPPGLARLIDDFMRALDLEGVTLVGNDTGGALCQLVATRHPGRLARLVLTSCDAFENFPPRMFRYLALTARVPGGMTLLAKSMRLPGAARMPFSFGWVTKRSIPRDLLAQWTGPVIGDAAIRRDAGKVIRGIDPSYTLETAERLRDFDKPALVAWGADDKFFPVEHGERLAKILPDARFVRIPDSRSFVSVDQPERLADAIAGFVRETAAAPATEVASPAG